MATRRFCILLLFLASSVTHSTAAPLKVIVMAGQSNTVGHGYAAFHDRANQTTNNGTLLTPEFAFLRQGDGWTSRSDVWIVFNETASAPWYSTGFFHGNLTVGYGGINKNQSKTHLEVGPELGFGWALGDAMDEQVLLIKTAWGGKSLDVDFRPPSSGGTVGPYYTKLVDGVADALKNIPAIFPGATDYELVGFSWFQGWNDACCSDATSYETDLANLIRDLRRDLVGSPGDKLNVVVGTLGMCGYAPYVPETKECGRVCQIIADDIIPAQLAVGDATKYPEFAGNVVSVETRGFYRDPATSPGGQCYHWDNNAASYWDIGQALGKSMVKLLL